MRVRPPHATPEQVASALGDEPLAEVLAGRVHAALPALAMWEAELDEDPDAARRGRSPPPTRLLAHRFDLLGSGPAELGPRIDWHRDFKQGRRWPLVHHTRIRTSYGDGSDIKVPWSCRAPSTCRSSPPRTG